MRIKVDKHTLIYPRQEGVGCHLVYFVLRTQTSRNNPFIMAFRMEALRLFRPPHPHTLVAVTASVPVAHQWPARPRTQGQHQLPIPGAPVPRLGRWGRGESP